MSKTAGNVNLTALKLEHMTNPAGIDIKKPGFSWEIVSKIRGIKQKAYQIQVSCSQQEFNGDQVIWDTGRVLSDVQAHIVYAGPALESRVQYWWRVRIWDETDAVTGWSKCACWEMGLLSKSDWLAQWVEPRQEKTPEEPPIPFFQKLAPVPADTARDYSRLKPCQYLRRSFTADHKPVKARIYATAHGVYFLELNGSRVGSCELAPEVTAYDRYLQYQTYDVTALILPGENVVGAVVSDGWYIGRIGLPGDSCQYGDKLALLLQLELEYSDGTRQVVNTDSSFKSSTGPLVYSDLFIGERYDARLEMDGWSAPGFRDDSWSPVEAADYGYANLAAQYGECVKAVETLTPLCVIETPKGEIVVDLGQNMAGRLRMRVEGPAGTEIMLEFSETLDENGNFFNNIIGRNKDQRDFYVLKGGKPESYEQIFTCHGFRYVRVTGYPGEVRAENFTGIVLASELRRTGDFECSDVRLNKLQSNIVWSQKSNMISIPTDCPQRERAGFTGDAQVFIATACFNMDVLAFFRRWLKNLVLEQRPDGQVPVVAPYWKSYIETFLPVQNGSHTSAGWGDACIYVPWALYCSYGDRRILEDNYAMMLKWLAYMTKEAETGIPDNLEGDLTPERALRQKYLWNTGFHFGDWLIPSLTAGYRNPFESARRTKELIATCFYACSTELVAEIANVLGKTEDSIKYAELSGRIRKAFAEEYLGCDGSLKSHFQGIYVLALMMRMIPGSMCDKVTDQLVQLIQTNGWRLDTGFVSVQYLMDALCRNGRADAAFTLLFQTECPSWLYEIEKGATTVWETWDAISPDGKVNASSFNHYAFGCVGDWLYRYVAGLDKDAPGYKHIVIQPHPDGRLHSAKARYHAVYGEILSDWSIAEGVMTLRCAIPPNTSASVVLPGAVIQTVREDGIAIRESADIFSILQKGNSVTLEINSGLYVFTYPYAGETSDATD